MPPTLDHPRARQFGEGNQLVDRAELALDQPRLEIGHEYLIHWSLYLPLDYRFDTQESPEGIVQIHQRSDHGPPPVSFVLFGSQYRIMQRGGVAPETRTWSQEVGDAKPDLGRWVRWTLHYRPRSSNGLTELRREGRTVLLWTDKPNAYVNDQGAYLKVGLYKWYWHQRDSLVAERHLYLTDLMIEERKP